MAEWTFKQDTGLRKKLLTAAHFAHPAKMHIPMLWRIIETYTKPGDVILDPMFGAGTTMVACLFGRNVIGVELEEKFVKMAQDNWEKLRQSPMLDYPLGWCKILQGDARNLDGLVPDAIITSPPYEGIEARDRSKETSFAREQSGNYPKRGDLGISKGYQADHIITSPPYEATNTTGRPDTYEGSHGPHSQVQLLDYRESATNIGNLKGQTYLEAMLVVYRQCYALLKPGGLMILVTKNFIRDRREVRLDQDTIRLCETAGFQLVERHHRKLTHMSFWRILYYRKYPTVTRIDREDILVFSKLGN